MVSLVWCRRPCFARKLAYTCRQKVDSSIGTGGILWVVQNDRKHFFADVHVCSISWTCDAKPIESLNICLQCGDVHSIGCSESRLRRAVGMTDRWGWAYGTSWKNSGKLFRDSASAAPYFEPYFEPAMCSDEMWSHDMPQRKTNSMRGVLIACALQILNWWQTPWFHGFIVTQEQYPHALPVVTPICSSTDQHRYQFFHCNSLFAQDSGRPGNLEPL